MDNVLLSRRRWIIRRKSDGAIICGLAQNYKFRKLEDIGDATIKTWRSKKQALSAFDRSWGDPEEFGVETVEVVEQICLLGTEQPHKDTHSE